MGLAGGSPLDSLDKGERGGRSMPVRWCGGSWCRGSLVKGGGPAALHEGDGPSCAESMSYGSSLGLCFRRLRRAPGSYWLMRTRTGGYGLGD
jgi:hypothetical protein